MANAQQVTTENGDEVNLKKVDADVMAKSVKALGIKVGKNATIQEMVGALSGYFAAKEAKGEESGNCSNCGITYTFDLDTCPACGTAADDEAEEGAGDEGSDDEEEAAPPPPAKPKPAPAAAKPEPAAPPATEAPARRKKKAPGAPAADVQPVGRVIVSEKDLNAAVAEYRAAVATANANGSADYWKVGQKLKVIYDADLWKQRVGEDGKPAYKSWDKFVTTEIGMSVTASYDAMRVAAFLDEATVRKIGSSKAALLLKAPEIVQDALLERAKGGASKREMEAEVKAAVEKYGPPKSKMKGSERTAKAAQANKGKSTGRGGKKVDKITVASIINEPHRIALFTEESIKAGPGHRVRATKFGQKPTGSLILVNGVELHIRVAMTDKGAVAVVNFKRTE